jgi:hypothetical protein
VSVRPLRPDTDRSLGEPLPHQLANRTRAPLQAPGLATPALISVYPNTGCHAVLALLSESYPPLEGRSPTRYSPVCHSTHPLRDFRVRLACVRHAASVDSEPGSNSQVKFVRPRYRPCGRSRGLNSINPKCLNILALGSKPRRSLPRRVRNGGSSSVRSPNHARWNRTRPDPALILDGLCLHVLSSFQRTGVVRRWLVPTAFSLHGQTARGEPSYFMVPVTNVSRLLFARRSVWRAKLGRGRTPRHSLLRNPPPRARFPAAGHGTRALGQRPNDAISLLCCGLSQDPAGTYTNVCPVG